jgi:NAD-dependent deacetylase
MVSVPSITGSAGSFQANGLEILSDQWLVDTLSNLKKLREALSRAREILAITGAGASAESGLKTFRGEDGWYQNKRAEELATLAAFNDDPSAVWRWYDERRQALVTAEPNAGHKAISAWENHDRHVTIITQNVDDLHERAGSLEVIHIHGKIWEVRCVAYGPVTENREVPISRIPPLCSCGARLRPNVVWFDEELRHEDSLKIEEYFSRNKIDLVLVIGTEATFDYIRSYALRARAKGALLAELNPRLTPLTNLVDIHISGTAASVLPLLSL